MANKKAQLTEEYKSLEKNGPGADQIFKLIMDNTPKAGETTYANADITGKIYAYSRELQEQIKQRIDTIINEKGNVNTLAKIDYRSTITKLALKMRSPAVNHLLISQYAKEYIENFLKSHPEVKADWREMKERFDTAIKYAIQMTANKEPREVGHMVGKLLVDAVLLKKQSPLKDSEDEIGDIFEEAQGLRGTGKPVTDINDVESFSKKK